MARALYSLFIGTLGTEINVTAFKLLEKTFKIHKVWYQFVKSVFKTWLTI